MKPILVTIVVEEQGEDSLKRRKELSQKVNLLPGNRVTNSDRFAYLARAMMMSAIDPLDLSAADPGAK